MTETQQSPRSMSSALLQKPRIGLVCDFREENWPSMDLVAEMLFERLVDEHAASLAVTRICPPLRPHFGRLPGLGHAPLFRNADRFLNRFIDYRRTLQRRTSEFDLFHLVDHSYSQLVHHLPPGRTIVTCHDLDTFRCVLEPERESRPRWFRAMTERILSGFQKAAQVIAVSANTRNEILRLGLIAPERVTVISNGVHPSCSPAENFQADSELRRVLPIESQEGIWLLSVGSSVPRKRLDLLLRVFAKVRRHVPETRLLRVGEAFTGEQRQLAQKLGVAAAITELGSLSRDVLAAAYRRAGLLLHTAEAEGFGLPLIEAMACGCPVIASDLPVLREVGGAAAMYCQVGDVEGWRDAVLTALQNRLDPDYRKRDRARAFANAARFSWSENAARTARVYEQVLGKGL